MKPIEKAVGIIILVGAAVYVWNGDGTAFIYRNVNAQAGHQTEAVSTWWRAKPDFLVTDYLLKDGELYLLFERSTKWDWFLAIIRRHEKWTTSRVKNLITSHPELRNLLPKPDEPNLGVKWLEPHD